jgi:endonuclease/exonuclease/phosphatase family metal-dependent hydrolase
MRQTPWFRCALVGLALVGACGGDDGGNTPDARPRPDAEVPIDGAPPDGGTSGLPETLPDPLPTGPVDTKVMTFNVGLIQLVRGSVQRLPHIIAAVEASDAEIVCFQEVYLQYTNPATVAAELADTYPYAAWTWEATNTIGPGTMIVSKVPLYRQRFLRYTMNDPNGTVDRAVIAATAVADDWSLNVLCTHIQAGLDAPSTAIRRDQIAELGDFVTEHGYATGPSVLLGDFNAGPEANPNEPTEECDAETCPSGCLAVDTQSITELETVYGWTDRSDEEAFTTCTWCKAEGTALALVDLFPCEGSQRIDHCFVRGLTGGSDITAQVRTMDQTVNIPLDSGANAQTLSDHYAVACTIAPP